MNERLLELIDGYLANTLDAAGMAELSSILSDDPAARATFVQYSQLDLELASTFRTPPISPRIEPSRTRKSTKLLPLLVAMAVSILILGVMAIRAVLHTDDPVQAVVSLSNPPEIAWLVNAQNCRWSDDTDLSQGMIAGRTLRIQSGLAELRFRNQARLILEGPAEIQLVSEMQVMVQRGRLSARIPETAHGFTVMSPQGKIVDLGTEFGVSVGEEGTTEVRVFEGEVLAATRSATTNAIGPTQSLTRQQMLRLGHENEPAKVQASDPIGDKRFTRAIVPPPVIVPRSQTWRFDRAMPNTIQDRDGQGVGLTHRLPGTGAGLPMRDPNLFLNVPEKRLELTTTNSDINVQINMPTGEYFGIPLADLGFTGREDFAISVTIPDIPALQRVGQFGLYAGDRSNRMIRGGLIRAIEKGQEVYRIFHVNNRNGRDTDSLFLGVFSTGDEVRMTLKRTDGKYALTVENLTAGSASTLSIRHPDYLDGLNGLHVGLFGANTFSDVRKTLVIRELTATVWTRSPAQP